MALVPLRFAGGEHIVMKAALGFASRTCGVTVDAAQTRVYPGGLVLNGLEVAGGAVRAEKVVLRGGKPAIDCLLAWADGRAPPYAEVTVRSRGVEGEITPGGACAAGDVLKRLPTELNLVLVLLLGARVQVKPGRSTPGRAQEVDVGKARLSGVQGGMGIAELSGCLREYEERASESGEPRRDAGAERGESAGARLANRAAESAARALAFAGVADAARRSDRTAMEELFAQGAPWEMVANGGWREMVETGLAAAILERDDLLKVLAEKQVLRRMARAGLLRAAAKRPRVVKELLDQGVLTAAVECGALEAVLSPGKEGLIRTLVSSRLLDALASSRLLESLALL